jgi:hypothetical protein
MPILWNVDEEMQQIASVAQGTRVTVNQDSVKGPATVA